MLEKKNCRYAVNHVFALAGMDLTANGVISIMFSTFKKTVCLPRKIKPPEWHLSLILKSLTCPPYELLKLLKQTPDLENLLSLSSRIGQKS